MVGGEEPFMTQQKPARTARPPNRVAAEIEGDFVVFIIGFRINRLWRLDAWLPVFLAMPKMLRELAQHPKLGLLGGQFAGFTLVQYWRSTEALNAYAKAREHEHLPAWKAFNRNARKAAGAVGIWHETFRVAAGQYETVYIDMPRHGLGTAGTLVPATGRRETAAGRLSGEEALQGAR